MPESLRRAESWLSQPRRDRVGHMQKADDRAGQGANPEDFDHALVASIRYGPYRAGPLQASVRLLSLNGVEIADLGSLYQVFARCRVTETKVRTWLYLAVPPPSDRR
jgi:hypothetical protein